MRRLGPLFLTALLLGLPRALSGRVFAARRSVYVLASEKDPELEDFARELGRALDEAVPEPPARLRAVAVEVEIHRSWRAPSPRGRAMGTLSVSVVQGERRRHLLLEYRREDPAGAARTLLKALPSPHLASA